MIKRIAALVKKDFMFNWKMALGVLTFPIIYYAGSWAEATFQNIKEEDAFLTFYLIASMSIMPINNSFNREKSASTKRFLSSLPIGAGELYIANMITTILYMSLLAAMSLLGIWMFNIPCGIQFVFLAMPIAILGSSLYTLIFYFLGFNAAQIFFLGAMMITSTAVAWMGDRFETMSFFTDPYVAIPACIAMVGLAILVIAILCKKKRRLL